MLNLNHLDVLRNPHHRYHNNLSQIREKMSLIDRAQQNISSLTENVVDLKNFLSNTTQRGRFGEMLLENLIKDHLPKDHYEFQKTLSNSSRVDCMIMSPGSLNKTCIDAKFPKESFEKFQKSVSKDEKLKLLKKFKSDIKNHISTVQEKYLISGETSDIALIFIPSEQVYLEIFRLFPELSDGNFPDASVHFEPREHGKYIKIQRFAALVYHLEINQIESLCKRIKAPNDYRDLAILTKNKPDSVYYGMANNIMSTEGRLIGTRFDKLMIMSLYMPSGTSGDERQKIKYDLMEKFEDEIIKLDQMGLDLIICGDWNIAHTKLDIKNWQSNQKNSGFLPEERDYMTKIFSNKFADAYRVKEPETIKYSWWSQRGNARKNNVGWRIDYQVISKNLIRNVVKADIENEPMLSDHAPVIIEYAF